MARVGKRAGRRRGKPNRASARWRAGATVLADLLQEQRVYAGVRQADLARAVGWASNAVSLVECAKRRLEVGELRAMCHAMGVDFAKFCAELDRRLGAAPEFQVKAVKQRFLPPRQLELEMP